MEDRHRIFGTEINGAKSFLKQKSYICTNTFLWSISAIFLGSKLKPFVIWFFCKYIMIKWRMLLQKKSQPQNTGKVCIQLPIICIMGLQALWSSIWILVYIYARFWNLHVIIITGVSPEDERALACESF